MNAGQHSARQLVSSHVLSRDTVCRSCLHRLSARTSRRHASAAAAVAEEPPSSHIDPTVPPVTASGPRKAFRLACSPIISRPPLLTRELTAFEKAFYLYQKRLNERLALPFTRYFYFERKTPADIEWKKKAKTRRGIAARDVGLYNAYAKDAWNDEELVGSKLGDHKDIYDKLIRDAEGQDYPDPEQQDDANTGELPAGEESEAVQIVRRAAKDVAIEKPMPRITEADKSDDRRSLNRKLDRTLYLLVKKKNGEWRFPEDRLFGKEDLHHAAERILVQAGGINMNTWVVGNHPVGDFISGYEEPILSKIEPNPMVGTPQTEFEQLEYGEKVFFMKTRIMAGQVDLSKNEYGDTDFRWLTKKEVRSKVLMPYWKWIQHMMTDR